jgi:hypothetical protein
MLNDKHLDSAIRWTIVAWVLLLLVLMAGDVRACDFDVDCEPGSRCVSGACVGGLWPGNDNDDRPLRDRPVWDLNETFGDTCDFDVDCGPGMRCLKQGGIEGACVRR